MIKKLISFKRKGNEHENVKSNEIYELPVPVVDMIPLEVSNKE
jgi:hypothetical protein